MFLEPSAAQLLSGIGLFTFLFDFLYVLAIKQHNKAKGDNNGAPFVLKHSMMARVGIVVLDVMICLCCVMAFTFQHMFFPFIPRIWAREGAAVVQVVGFTLVIGGDVVLFTSYRALGMCWAYPISGRSGKHVLVKQGPHKHVRHPVYDSFALITIGFVLIFMDWFLLLLCVMSAIGLYVQALDEEKALVAYFGEEHVAYVRETGRFLSRHRSRIWA